MKKRELYLEKFDTYKKDMGIDIISKSDQNKNALKKRLIERALLPKAEKNNYGDKTFSEKETKFLEFWKSDIEPEFTAKHGTTEIAKIEKAGSLMSVGDRRRTQSSYKNSRTGGRSRQEFNYLVMGIGNDHPIPYSVSKNATVISIELGKIKDNKLLKGAFIGGHTMDYVTSRTYPPLIFGDTRVNVKFNISDSSKTVTFTRKDGATIIESLNFGDEIVVAHPDFSNIITFLSHKLIEYLRFIGGDFQQEILECRDIKKISAVFHALFQSHRYPELKLSSQCVSLNHPNVKLIRPDKKLLQKSFKIHEATKKLDIQTLETLVYDEKIDINTVELSIGGSTPLFSLISNTSHPSDPEKYYETVRWFLNNGANINQSSTLTTPIDHALRRINSDAHTYKLLLEGAVIPACPTIRELPHITVDIMKIIISQCQEDAFSLLYPLFRQNFSADMLIFHTYKCHENAPQNNEAKTILTTLLADCDPNYTQNATLLMSAATNGNVFVVNKLLKKANIQIHKVFSTKTHEISEFEGWTALDFAIHYKQDQVVRILKEKGAKVGIQKNKLQAKFRDNAGAAIVTAENNGKKYVLMVRKSNRYGDATGLYLFPGGIKDPEDLSYCITAMRETINETLVDLNGVKGKKIYAISEVVNETQFKREFYQFDLGDCKLPTTFARSDVALAEWVCVDDIVSQTLNITFSMKISDIPLRQDNALILQSILTEEPLDNESVRKGLLLSFNTDLINNFSKAIAELPKNDLQYQKAKEHIDCGCIDPQILLYNEKSPMAIACESGDKNRIDDLMELGIDINQRLTGNIRGLTALEVLINNEHYKTAKYIMQKYNADPAYYIEGVSPLVATCGQKQVNMDFLQFLLKTLDTLSEKELGSCVVTLINYKANDALEILLSNYSINLNRNFQRYNCSGDDNPLWLAIFKENVKAVELLLMQGASPKYKYDLYSGDLYKETLNKMSFCNVNLKMISKREERGINVDPSAKEENEKAIELYKNILDLFKQYCPEIARGQESVFGLTY